MTDLGDISYYLGIKVTKDENGIYSISEAGYIDKLLKSYNMETAKESKIPLDVGYNKIKDNTNIIEKKVSKFDRSFNIHRY